MVNAPTSLVGWLLLAGFLLTGMGCALADWDFAQILQNAEKRYGPLGPAKGRISARSQMLKSELKQPEREQLNAVNRFFNQQLDFQDDTRIWRQTDYWATPEKSLIKGAGDSKKLSRWQDVLKKMQAERFFVGEG